MPDIVNTEQAQAWNGPEGAHWARNQDRWNAVSPAPQHVLADHGDPPGRHRMTG